MKATIQKTSILDTSKGWILGIRMGEYVVSKPYTSVAPKYFTSHQEAVNCFKNSCSM